MRPPRACLEPRRLAVISEVAGSLPDPRGVVYGDKLYLGKTLLVVDVKTYVRRLLFIIIFALFGYGVRCVLHCGMTWDGACESVINKETVILLTNLLHNNKDIVKLKKVYCIISNT